MSRATEGGLGPLRCGPSQACREGREEVGREKGLSSRAASYTADKANRNPSGSYTRDANRGNNDTESAAR
jgi:hypothetical protein